MDIRKIATRALVKTADYYYGKRYPSFDANTRSQERRNVGTPGSVSAPQRQTLETSPTGYNVRGKGQQDLADEGNARVGQAIAEANATNELYRQQQRVAGGVNGAVDTGSKLVGNVLQDEIAAAYGRAQQANNNGFLHNWLNKIRNWATDPDGTGAGADLVAGDGNNNYGAKISTRGNYDLRNLWGAERSYTVNEAGAFGRAPDDFMSKTLVRDKNTGNENYVNVPGADPNSDVVRARDVLWDHNQRAKSIADKVIRNGRTLGGDDASLNRDVQELLNNVIKARSDVNTFGANGYTKAYRKQLMQGPLFNELYNRALVSDRSLDRDAFANIFLSEGANAARGLDEHLNKSVATAPLPFDGRSHN